MRKFAETCEAIAGTTKKLVKVGYRRGVLEVVHVVEEASVSAVFLSGKPFPASEENYASSRREALVGGRERAFRKE